MVAKKIDLGTGLKFESIDEAKIHFDNILKTAPLEQPVADADFKALKLLYEAYCRKTNWPMPSLPSRPMNGKKGTQPSVLASNSRMARRINSRSIKHYQRWLNLRPARLHSLVCAIL